MASPTRPLSVGAAAVSVGALTRANRANEATFVKVDVYLCTAYVPRSRRNGPSRLNCVFTVKRMLRAVRWMLRAVRWMLRAV
eukprot:524882-Prorocentrum_minimum.AAC.1